MTVRHLEPSFVETFPTTLRPGVLYVSIEFTTCAHLCACGCGEEVITPLSPPQWSLTYNGRDVSLHPSVGNWALPCKSHYIVDRGRIRWSYQFTKEQIAANRARDRRAIDRYDLNEVLPDWDELETVTEIPADRRKRVWTRFRRLLRRRN
ncbi:MULTISPECIES: DUF6527 family protein [Janibacter]|uniref:DUF6527 family protein n=1 Tax=Janibacter TaxID=53457 RepID=UPI002491BF60|nr:DUF6527 family protein [Janibacter hoylei]